MNYQWILLAFFLVAIILGTVKSLKRDMLKNLLRLGSVVVAFLITFFLQLGGVFQGVVRAVANALDLASLLSDFAFAMDLALALAGTIVSILFFVPVFFLILGILRIVVFIVLKAVAKKAAAKAPKVEAVEAQAAEEGEKTEVTEEVATEGEQAEVTEAVAEEAEKAEVTEAVDEEAETAKVTEEVAEQVEETEKKSSKKKKTVFYREKAWKRAVSVASGVISGVLVLGVLLLPVFYTMGLVSTAAHATEGTDADDSQVYKVVAVVDSYLVEPYEKSFVGGFYDVFGLSDLMCYTAKLGSKMVLDDGSVAYATDALKSLLSHGVSAAAQITSAKSECATVREDVNAIISDPALSSVLADALMGYIRDMETEVPEEDDLMGTLVYDFMQYYKQADKPTVQKDMMALSNTIGALAEERILAQLLSGNADFEEMLEDEETLGNVVSAISGLSAFGPTIEDAFEVGIDAMGETLQIPHNDAEAYDIFMEDLLSQMQKSSNVAFDINTIRYYILKCVEKDVKVSSTNGIKGHSQFTAYVAHWEKVQLAFEHASEDKSYGYFTIEINGQWYVYDKTARKIVVYNADTEAEYKNKISPVAGIINALALRSTTSRLTRDNLYSILNAYVASSTDEVSVEVANRILAKEDFVSRAVTIEKMLAATNFTDWTDEEKEEDSKLCVHIIVEILELMDHLSNLENEEGIEGALDLLDEFVLLGETMDTMQKTTCIKELPPLLIEAIVKNELFTDFIKPSTAFQINSIVENNNKTYTDCMKQIADVLAWAIHSFGDSFGGETA